MKKAKRAAKPLAPALTAASPAVQESAPAPGPTTTKAAPAQQPSPAAPAAASAFARPLAALWPKPPMPPRPTRSVPPAAGSQTVGVAFTVNAPEAKKVVLCGEFNQWSPEATPMKRQSDGRWMTTVALQPGRYQYKFVADGQWLPDPGAREAVPNPFGSLNSVVEVRI
jgi:hypothetical protein